MNKDLTYILNGKIPRIYGDKPINLGNYEMIAPSPEYEMIMKAFTTKKDVNK